MIVTKSNIDLPSKYIRSKSDCGSKTEKILISTESSLK